MFSTADHVHDWEDIETFCEDCGTHPALWCEDCETMVDLVMEEDPRE